MSVCDSLLSFLIFFMTLIVLRSMSQVFQCVFIPSTHQEIHSILIISIWRKHQIPQIMGSIQQDSPLHPLQMPIEVQVFTCAFDPWTIDWRFPWLLSFSSINLLEWLTELREIFTYYIMSTRKGRRRLQIIKSLFSVLRIAIQETQSPVTPKDYTEEEKESGVYKDKKPWDC